MVKILYDSLTVFATFDGAELELLHLGMFIMLQNILMMYHKMTFLMYQKMSLFVFGKNVINKIFMERTNEIVLSLRMW